ncbi:hypothetical protein [Oceanibacterium hippocampi]|uniref:Uncharacterized protein n=1 Tax=Oceanibacterium hippocampi TaxID=745714 RepID=A0A1Y5U1V9_9PROT|nr:hypothetical protein [Oceanibacterium hippocampi]SLN74484.1 hypothetical protein OCH7691_03759 [Oceanibacterium hippocampi]
MISPDEFTASIADMVARHRDGLSAMTDAIKPPLESDQAVMNGVGALATPLGADVQGAIAAAMTVKSPEQALAVIPVVLGFGQAALTLGQSTEASLTPLPETSAEASDKAVVAAAEQTVSAVTASARSIGEKLKP